MAGNLHMKKQWLWSRFLFVTICLCAFMCLPVSQFTTTWAETAEPECPSQNDGETAEEEFVVSAAACRRGDQQHWDCLSFPSDTGSQSLRAAWIAGQSPGRDCHQFDNGSRAPLRI